MIEGRVLSIVCALGAVALGHSQAAPTYTYYDLGLNVIPESISGNGYYIAGYSGVTPGIAYYSHVTWAGSTPTVGADVTVSSIFGAGTASNFGFTSSVAYGVNDNGWVVGQYSMNTTTPWPAATVSGFLWVTNSSQFLTPAGWGANQTPVYAVNDNYAIVGNNVNLEEAYIYTPNLGMFLTSPHGPGTSTFLGINDYGYACGTSTGFITGACAAFVNSSGWVAIQGASGADAGTARSINNNSALCGDDSTGAWRCAYPSALQYIGSTSKNAYCINDNGYVVGTCTATGGAVHAMLSTSGASLTDLNTAGVVTSRLPSGYTLVQANSVDQTGDIVGYAKDSGGNLRGFLLAKTN